MMVVPVATPLTIPAVPTVATVMSDEVQLPPGKVAEMVMSLPLHTVVSPVSVPATGSAFTVMIAEVVQLPSV